MATTVKSARSKNVPATQNREIGTFIGEMFSFNSALKLYHWHVTGPGSYAQHIAIDQALETLLDVIDRITETTYALKGDIEIKIPETKRPDNITKFATDFYKYVEKHRDLFEESWAESILDDYQEAVQQLIYRLARLK